MFAEGIATIQTIIEIYGLGFPVALIIAMSCALFGVFVVLKRVVFIGITLSEAAGCGIAFGLILGWHPFWGAFLMAILVVLLLGLPFERWLGLTRDAVLGILFVSFSAGSIILVAKSGFGLEKVKTLLFGSLLFASTTDLVTIAVVLIPSSIWLLASYRPLHYAFLDPDAAQVLGVPVKLLEFLFFAFLGAVVAAASKIAGVLLIFCYLVVAPSTALLLHRRLAGVLVLAVGIAWLGTFGGILLSYRHDLPPNQTVGLLHCGVFLLACLTRTGIPGIAWKSGVPFVTLGTMTIVAWLISLPMTEAVPALPLAAPSSAAVSEPNHPGVPGPQDPPQQAMNPDAPDWPTSCQAVLDHLDRDGFKAIPESLAFLGKDPPLLFRSQIVSKMNALAGVPTKWDIRSPATARINLDARDDLLKLVAAQRPQEALKP